MSGKDLNIPEFYLRYAEPILDYPLIEALDYSRGRSVALIKNLPDERGNFRYQDGKWTIKEVLCHMLDVERIMAYRALRFARNDATVLQGFDENRYATEANAEYRKLDEILRERINLANSTRDLFTSFSGTMMSRTGVANGVEFSVSALGYIIAGHSLHHCTILVERYGVKA